MKQPSSSTVASYTISYPGAVGLPKIRGSDEDAESTAISKVIEKAGRVIVASENCRGKASRYDFTSCLKSSGVNVNKSEIRCLLKRFESRSERGLYDVERLRDFCRRAERQAKDEDRRWHREETRRINCKAKVMEESRASKHSLASTSAAADFEFDERDRVRALRKLAKAALTFDPSRNSGPAGIASRLDRVMSPRSFKGMLRSSLNVDLTSRQLGALVSHFDEDGSGDVDGKEFKVEFGRISAAARRAVKVRNERQAEKVRRHYRKLKEDSVRRFNRSSTEDLDVSFSGEDYDAAMSKLGKVARFYDKSRSNPTDGFAGLLDPPSFRQQLRLVFGLRFKPRQLAALMSHFDSDKNGLVDGSEFLVGFAGISQREKANEREKNKQNQRERKDKLQRAIDNFRTRAKPRGGRPERTLDSSSLPRVSPVSHESGNRDSASAPWAVRKSPPTLRVTTSQAMRISPGDKALGKLLATTMVRMRDVYKRGSARNF